MKFPAWLNVEGDRDYRGPCPVETSEQIEFFNAVRRRWPSVSPLALHPRNEGKRSAWKASLEKLEGMLPGAPDIVIVGSPCVVIELKRRDHSRSAWEPGQLDVLRAMHDAGAVVYVALGAEAALAIIRRHFGGPQC